jgi:ATP-dependent exoDNAse (exonuclease V) beta subunit
MEFSLVVADPERRLSASRLARSLGYADELTPRGSASVKRPEWLSEGYLRQVRDLPFAAWSGFLRGFIDLTFEHEGRLYALDYKSNYLGAHLEDYNSERLGEAMEQHHYFLQALLYALALHRYGQVRIPGYDYEMHFGGMHYLFVRGMHPDHAQSGVLSFRPSREVIESLDSVFSNEFAQSQAGEGA